MFEEGRWTAQQFHANTEFYADYGRYDVRMTVPRGWVVGATGREQSRADNADGTTTHRYVQDDVHDFAWTTSPDYVEHHAALHASVPAGGGHPSAPAAGASPGRRIVISRQRRRRCATTASGTARIRTATSR